MSAFRRLAAIVVILVSTVILLASLAIAVGIWVVKEPATAKAMKLFGRIDGALDTGEQSLAQVKTSLTRAGERLGEVRTEQRKLAQEPRKGNTMGRLIGRTVQRQVAPEIGNAHEKLHTVAEAAIVVNTVLEDISNIPALSMTGLDTSRIAEMNNRLVDIGPAAWELSRLLGEPEQGQDAAEQLTRIEQSVNSLQRLVGEYESQFTQIRQRAAEAKSTALAWVFTVVVLISFVSFWIAMSQLGMLLRAWSWVK